MRKRSNLLRSSKSRTYSASLNDLVTQSQQTISSQASIYTNHSKNSQRSGNQFPQSSTHTQDFDDYEDIIAEDIDTLFITAQQEKKIQNILQFARKGKINAGNAFEIPVRVIDPQLTESANMRFWKFSSELLSASMSIYDKRVENMYQNTNRMFDNIIRVQGKPDQPLTEEEVEEKHKKQRGDLIQMEVGDIGKVYEIGTINCEQQEKINIKNKHHQFLPDPLFQKRLQAFDSNTLKSLFLNAFEFGSDMQITFFNRQEAKKEEVKMEIEPKIQEKLEESMEQYEERMPKLIGQQLPKLGSLVNSSIIFSELNNFKKENMRESIENARFEVRDFTGQLKFMQNTFDENKNLVLPSNDSEAAQTNSISSFQGETEFNFQFNVPDHTQLSEDTQHESQSMPYSYPVSSAQTQSEFYFEDENQSYTEMTPWELEFKGMKLQKRRMKRARGENANPKRPNKLSQKKQIEINFLDGIVQSKTKIWAKTKIKMQTSSNNYKDINLLPKTMNPFSEAYKKRRMNNLRQINQIIHHHNTHEDNFLQGDDIKAEQIDPQATQIVNQPSESERYPQESNSQKTTNFESNLFHEQHETQGVVYRSTNIRNLRDIKQKIYKHILQGRTIKLSELNININPNSILNNINITPIDDEFDIEISPRLP